MQALKVGDVVRATYKTGEYIGELTEIREAKQKGVVKILAVHKHPQQGNLHRPTRAVETLFQERRALAYREHASVPLSTIQPYEGEVPEYGSSLQQAVAKEMNQLQEMDTEWAQHSLANLERLKEEYEKH